MEEDKSKVEKEFLEAIFSSPAYQADKTSLRQTEPRRSKRHSLKTESLPSLYPVSPEASSNDANAPCPEPRIDRPYSFQLESPRGPADNSFRKSSAAARSRSLTVLPAIIETTEEPRDLDSDSPQSSPSTSSGCITPRRRHSGVFKVSSRPTLTSIVEEFPAATKEATSQFETDVDSFEHTLDGASCLGELKASETRRDSIPAPESDVDSFKHTPRGVSGAQEIKEFETLSKFTYKHSADNFSPLQMNNRVTPGSRESPSLDSVEIRTEDAHLVTVCKDKGAVTNAPNVTLIEETHCKDQDAEDSCCKVGLGREAASDSCDNKGCPTPEQFFSEKDYGNHLNGCDNSVGLKKEDGTTEEDRCNNLNDTIDVGLGVPSGVPQLDCAGSGCGEGGPQDLGHCQASGQCGDDAMQTSDQCQTAVSGHCGDVGLRGDYTDVTSCRDNVGQDENCDNDSKKSSEENHDEDNGQGSELDVSRGCQAGDHGICSDSSIGEVVEQAPAQDFPSQPTARPCSRPELGGLDGQFVRCVGEEQVMVVEDGSPDQAVLDVESDTLQEPDGPARVDVYIQDLVFNAFCDITRDAGSTPPDAGSEPNQPEDVAASGTRPRASGSNPLLAEVTCGPSSTASEAPVMARESHSAHCSSSADRQERDTDSSLKGRNSRDRDTSKRKKERVEERPLVAAKDRQSQMWNATGDVLEGSNTKVKDTEASSWPRDRREVNVKCALEHQTSQSAADNPDSQPDADMWAESGLESRGTTPEESRNSARVSAINMFIKRRTMQRQRMSASANQAELLQGEVEILKDFHDASADGEHSTSTDLTCGTTETDTTESLSMEGFNVKKPCGLESLNTAPLDAAPVQALDASHNHPCGAPCGDQTEMSNSPAEMAAEEPLVKVEGRDEGACGAETDHTMEHVELRGNAPAGAVGAEGEACCPFIESEAQPGRDATATGEENAAPMEVKGENEEQEDFDIVETGPYGAEVASESMDDFVVDSKLQDEEFSSKEFDKQRVKEAGDLKSRSNHDSGPPEVFARTIEEEKGEEHASKEPEFSNDTEDLRADVLNCPAMDGHVATELTMNAYELEEANTESCGNDEPCVKGLDGIILEGNLKEDSKLGGPEGAAFNFKEHCSGIAETYETVRDASDGDDPSCKEFQHSSELQPQIEVAPDSLIHESRKCDDCVEVLEQAPCVALAESQQREQGLHDNRDAEFEHKEGKLEAIQESGLIENNLLETCEIRTSEDGGLNPSASIEDDVPGESNIKGDLSNIECGPCSQEGDSAQDCEQVKCENSPLMEREDQVELEADLIVQEIETVKSNKEEDSLQETSRKYSPHEVCENTSDENEIGRRDELVQTGSNEGEGSLKVVFVKELDQKKCEDPNCLENEKETRSAHDLDEPEPAFEQEEGGVDEPHVVEVEVTLADHQMGSSVEYDAGVVHHEPSDARESPLELGQHGASGQVHDTFPSSLGPLSEGLDLEHNSGTDTQAHYDQMSSFETYCFPEKKLGTNIPTHNGAVSSDLENHTETNHAICNEHNYSSLTKTLPEDAECIIANADNDEEQMISNQEFPNKEVSDSLDLCMPTASFEPTEPGACERQHDILGFANETFFVRREEEKLTRGSLIEDNVDEVPECGDALCPDVLKQANDLKKRHSENIVSEEDQEKMVSIEEVNKVCEEVDTGRNLLNKSETEEISDDSGVDELGHSQETTAVEKPTVLSEAQSGKQEPTLLQDESGRFLQCEAPPKESSDTGLEHFVIQTLAEIGGALGKTEPPASVKDESDSSVSDHQNTASTQSSTESKLSTGDAAPWGKAGENTAIGEVNSYRPASMLRPEERLAGQPMSEQLVGSVEDGSGQDGPQHLEPEVKVSENNAFDAEVVSNNESESVLGPDSYTPRHNLEEDATQITDDSRDSESHAKQQEGLFSDQVVQELPDKEVDQSSEQPMPTINISQASSSEAECDNLAKISQSDAAPDPECIHQSILDQHIGDYVDEDTLLKPSRSADVIEVPAPIGAKLSGSGCGECLVQGEEKVEIHWNEASDPMMEVNTINLCTETTAVEHAVVTKILEDSKVGEILDSKQDVENRALSHEPGKSLELQGKEGTEDPGYGGARPRVKLSFAHVEAMKFFEGETLLDAFKDCENPWGVEEMGEKEDWSSRPREGGITETDLQGVLQPLKSLSDTDIGSEHAREGSRDGEDTEDGEEEKEVEDEEEERPGEEEEDEEVRLEEEEEEEDDVLDATFGTIRPTRMSPAPIRVRRVEVNDIRITTEHVSTTPGSETRSARGPHRKKKPKVTSSSERHLLAPVEPKSNTGLWVKFRKFLNAPNKGTKGSKGSSGRARYTTTSSPDRKGSSERSSVTAWSSRDTSSAPAPRLRSKPPQQAKVAHWKTRIRHLRGMRQSAEQQCTMPPIRRQVAGTKVSSSSTSSTSTGLKARPSTASTASRASTASSGSPRGPGRAARKSRKAGASLVEHQRDLVPATIPEAKSGAVPGVFEVFCDDVDHDPDARGRSATLLDLRTAQYAAPNELNPKRETLPTTSGHRFRPSNRSWLCTLM